MGRVLSLAKALRLTWMWNTLMTMRNKRSASQKSVIAICLFTLSVGVPTLLLSIGCQQVPVTNRSQLLVTSMEKENEMGLSAYQEVLKTEPLTKNERAVEMVRRVGQRIADVANRPDFEWEFNVIESETQNAFCLPGGKVAVYTGILSACENEAGLAVVMSHEVAHAIARHGGERMTYQTAQNMGKTLGGYLMRNQEEQKQKIVLTAYGAASEYGVILPYSRKHELEADHIGILLMAKAGYDPSEAPIFWERFSASKQGAAPMEFMSTHPSDSTRAATLRELLPQALENYSNATTKYGLGEAIQ